MKDEKKSFNYKNTGNKKVQPKDIKPALKKPAKPAITDWFFMTSQEVTAKDLSDFLKPLNLGELDLWEEMNILTLELTDKISIDFEGLKGGFSDGKDRLFLKENGYTTVFSVSVSGEYSGMKELFEKILAQFPGGFHGDTEDFSPSILSRR